MFRAIGKWLKVYPEEAGVFLWSTLLYFLIWSSEVILNNYAGTAFLKRFGVEYMPLAFMANAVATFFLMGFFAGILGRVPGARLMSKLFVICGVSVAGLRLLIPLGFDLVYPVLFVFEAQYEVIFGLIFWNLANDLFNTRQSKRLFPLITAGGVLGGVIGSFATPYLAKLIRLDNLLFFFLCINLTGALMVRMMGARFPTLLLPETKRKQAKERSSIVSEFKKVWPMLKESKLVQILVALTLFPNVLIPILNYQFNFAADSSFATEGGMIKFFSVFRGFLNVISLVILLFVGKIYGRWGLPVALMFHPFNYAIAFLAMLFHFDLVTAMYGRITTVVLRTTINNPARAILVGLVPAAYRSVVRPFLRGTVVRIGILAGSGLIMASTGLVHPRYLSAAALVFTGLWIAYTFVLKRSYSGILLDLLSRNMIDLRSLEAGDLGPVFRDKAVRSRLAENFLSSQGSECLWYARLLKSLDIPDLDALILRALKDRDDATRIGLLELLSPRAGNEAAGVFSGLAETENPRLLAALVRAAGCLPPELHSDFAGKVFESTAFPEVKAHAVACLYPAAPARYRETISEWLRSENVEERKAGVIAAGGSGDDSFVPRLEEMLRTDGQGILAPEILKALRRISPSGINTTALPYLHHAQEPVRLAALAAFAIGNDRDLSAVIGLLGDSSEEVHALAKEKILGAEHQNVQLLVKSLGIPGRRVREGLFELLEASDTKDLDVFRFARFHMEKAFGALATIHALSRLPESPERDLLIDHMDQRRRMRTENILRVLAAQDRTGNTRIIWRGLSSADARQRSNSLEALEDSIDSSLAGILLPLLEDLSPSECLAVGRKNFQLPDLEREPGSLFNYLLSKENWVTLVLALKLLGRHALDGVDMENIRRLSLSDNPHVSGAAAELLAREDSSSPEKKGDAMETGLTITDKILHLRRIQIFEGLSVGELAAIASVTEEAAFEAGKTVFREGDPGDNLYLILDGEVSILKEQGGAQGCGEIELARIGNGDYFGEMALFEDTGRSATIRTTRESRFLVLYKREFTEIVREYPQIAIHICKVLSQRIRRQDEKIENYEREAACGLPASS